MVVLHEKCKLLIKLFINSETGINLLQLVRQSNVKKINFHYSNSIGLYGSGSDLTDI